jgi:hypothetical protein
MAQTQRRMIYSKIWSSAQFGKLSDKAKLLFIGSITLADDDGLLIGTPSYLRGQIFPFDEKISVSEALQFRNEIKNNGLFIVYSIDGIDYIEHPNWSIYQKIRKDLYKKSSLPYRNETVTKPLRKCSLSKDKISKDKISKDKRGETSSPLQVKKKNMKTYNENEHSDSDIPSIDLDTGETPTKEKKQPKNKLALEIQRLFILMAKKTTGVMPIKDSKGYFVVIDALKYLTKKQIIDLFKDWFGSGRSDNEIVSITRALSHNNINKFKIENGIKN